MSRDVTWRFVTVRFVSLCFMFRFDLNRRRAGRGRGGGQDHHEGRQVFEGGGGRQGPACGARVRRGGARAPLLPHSDLLLRRGPLLRVQAALWGEKSISMTIRFKAWCDAWSAKFNVSPDAL